FTCVLVSSSPAGFRLEIAFKIDKKKNEKKEFYFSSRTKIFLTRKEKHACPRETKKQSRRGFVRDGSSSCSEAINRFTSPWGRYASFERIDTCTHFSRLQRST